MATIHCSGPALEEGLATRELIEAHRPDAEIARRPGPVVVAEVVAGLLSDPDGPRVAVLELGGWDTHANQAGVLQRQLGELAEALVGLERAMESEAWRQTVVLGVTEFGRTVAANGTGGTDHGVGGAALLAGGAIAGGRVWADWPGLEGAALLEGRDLRPTLDLRAAFAGVLSDHLGLSRRQLHQVFPERPPRPMEGLVG